MRGLGRTAVRALPGSRRIAYLVSNPWDTKGSWIREPTLERGVGGTESLTSECHYCRSYDSSDNCDRGPW